MLPNLKTYPSYFDKRNRRVSQPCFGIVEGIQPYGVIDMNNVVASSPTVFVAKKHQGNM